MIFSYNFLQSFFKEKLPIPQKLADILVLHSFEVESVKKTGDDWVLDVDILPNRAHDCFSHFGIAREFGALLGKKVETGNWNPTEDKSAKSSDFVEIKTKEKMACPRYTARVICDIKVGSSPEWMEKRLRSCGYRPINNIVDAANYVMIETGQPLHAFDFDMVSDGPSGKKEIIVRYAKPGEKIISLDNKEYKLNKSMLVIADNKEALAIAGIKGGKKAEINKNTKNIILESANFSPLGIRLTSRVLGLKTDSSLRFEHEIDPSLAPFAINRVAQLIQLGSKGKVLSGMIDLYPKKILKNKIYLELRRLNSLLGIEITKVEAIKILKDLDFKVKDTGKILEVIPPEFRLDINIEEDLIEEIARVYGYQKVPSVLPQGVLIPPKRNESLFWADFSRNILKEAGFSEVLNYSFVGEKEKDIFQFGNYAAELENPMSQNQKYLRTSLIFNLLKDIKENLKRFNEVKIFEIGKIFKKKKNNILEKIMMAGAISSIGTEKKEELFYGAKGVADSLFEGLGISDIWYDEYKPTPEDSIASFWEKGKCAEIKTKEGSEIGFLGEINSAILRKMEIGNPVVVFDLDFEKLCNIASEEHEYRPISQHPSAIRDLAVLVPEGILVEEVLNKIETVGGELIRDIDLFDIYEGEEFSGSNNKKSLAFHIIFQAEDRTLKPEEINGIMNKIVASLEGMEWEIRR